MSRFDSDRELMADWVMRSRFSWRSVLMASVALAAVGCSRDPLLADGVTTTSNDAASSNASTLHDDSNDSSTSDDETDSSSSTLVPGKDALPYAACDPFAQDCPEGEKCVPFASTGGNWDANKCVPVTGDKQPGESCTYGGVAEATDDCDASSHCWDVVDVDGQLMGVCTSFCSGTPDNPECPDKTSCLIANDGSIALCVTTCDPVAQDCGEGLECVWANGTFHCIFTGGGWNDWIGEPCDQIADCPPGGICLSAAVFPECAASACCAQFCSLADPSCELEGTACMPFFDGDPPEGYEDVGVCIVP